MPTFFSEQEFRAARAAIDVLIPETPAVSADEVADRADEFLSEVNTPNGNEIRQGLMFLELAFPISIGKLPPFSSLPRQDRREVLEKLIDGPGPLRDLARLLKLLTYFSYYTHPDGRRSIGYVEFEERPRFPTLDTTPLRYPPECR